MEDLPSPDGSERAKRKDKIGRCSLCFTHVEKFLMTKGVCPDCHKYNVTVNPSYAAKFK